MGSLSGGASLAGTELSTVSSPPKSPHCPSIDGSESRRAAGSTRWPYSTEASDRAWLRLSAGGGSQICGGQRSVMASYRLSGYSPPNNVNRLRGWSR